MARSAKVTSIDAVQRFAGVLRRFQEDASSALENLAMELQRSLDWIQNNQKDYWALQARRSYERVGEAKASLQRCRTYHRIADHEPSCIEEKRAVEREKRRLLLAEEKVETVRHWSRAADRAMTEYYASVSQLASWLDAECPRALATLDRLSAALHAYAALESTAGAADAALAAAGLSHGEAGDEAASPAASQREQPKAPDARRADADDQGPATEDATEQSPP